MSAIGEPSVLNTVRSGSSTATTDGGHRSPLWHLLLLCVCLFVCLTFFAKPMLSAFLPQNHHLVDFHQEWLSGRNFWTGRPVYGSLDASLRAHGLKTINATTAVFNVNAHPPAMVLAALPFALLPSASAFLAWNSVCLAFLLLSVTLILRELEARLTLCMIAVLLCGFLASDPIFLHFFYGQVNLWMLMLLTLAWVADRRGWSVAAGSLVGMAAALKFFPGFLIVYFLGRRDWRATAATVTGFVGLNLVTLAVLGVDAYRGYLELGLPSASSFRGAFGNASLPAFWIKTLAPTGQHGPAVPVIDAAWLAPVLGLLSVAAVAGLTWRAAGRAETVFDRDRAFALGLVGMLLASPVTWDHYFVLLLLPLFLAGFCSANSAIQWLTFGVSAALLWLTTVRWLQVFDGPAFVPSTCNPWQTLAYHSLQCYALIGLFGVLWTLRPRSDVPATAAA